MSLAFIQTRNSPPLRCVSVSVFRPSFASVPLPASTKLIAHKEHFQLAFPNAYAHSHTIAIAVPTACVLACVRALTGVCTRVYSLRTHTLTHIQLVRIGTRRCYGVAPPQNTEAQPLTHALSVSVVRAKICVSDAILSVGYSLP